MRDVNFMSWYTAINAVVIISLHAKINKIILDYKNTHTHTHIYIYIYKEREREILVIQKSCNIFVPWGKIRQLQVHLSMSWSWRIILDCEMLTSPDTPSSTQENCLNGLACELRIHIFRSISVCAIVEVLANWEKFLKPSVINCAFTFGTTNVYRCFCSFMSWFELVKQKFPN